MLNSFQHLFCIRFRNEFGMTRNPTVMLNLFQHLFHIRFRNPLELLFHTTQSLILFALQILFAMLRAISSFGLRPHSTQNSQVWNDSFLYGFVIHFISIFHCGVCAFCTYIYLRCMTKIYIKLVAI